MKTPAPPRFPEGCHSRYHAVRDWAIAFGIDQSVLRRRVESYGWEKALAMGPKQPRERRSRPWSKKSLGDPSELDLLWAKYTRSPAPR